MTEKQLHRQICDYLNLQYPKVLFNTDMSGLKLTMGQAVHAKNLRSNNGFPDIVIYESHESWPNGESYKSHALFLEVKKESPYKKNSIELKKNSHIEMQIETHKLLEDKGYECEFVWSFDMAKKIIDEYLQ